jgi:hypothetical protein
MEETDMVQSIPFTAETNPACSPVANTCPAKLLGPAQRRDLALQALGGSFTISHLADQADVSRKFVYQQIDIANHALHEAFAPPPHKDDEVLFYIPVTPLWLHQNVLSLLLNCHSPYRGVINHFHDCLKAHISLGGIHAIVQDAVAKARTFNDQQPLDPIHTGLIDEIFQAQVPVLVGVDAASTYCFLLSQEAHCDGDTWGVHLLDLQKRGLDPDEFIADFGKGLRAGCAMAYEDTPCFGDVFHGLYKVSPVVATLEKQAYEAITACDDLKRKAANHQHRHGRANPSLTSKLTHATAKAEQAVTLADDVRILADWLREDIFAVAGPACAERRVLYDFVVAELRDRAEFCPHRLNPLCTFLDNQRDKLLGFAGKLDRDLAELAVRFEVSMDVLRGLLCLQHLSHTNPKRWQGESELRQQLHGRFHDINEAVCELANSTVRASSMVENLNSRLRSYFTLRRHLGAGYLALLQFFLNHHRFDRSERPERVGKSPAELLTGQSHPHWLAMLGYEPFCQN